MKNFSQFIGEAKEAKKCPDGKYWCFDDKKCKKIPRGYHVGRSGYLAHDHDAVSYTHLTLPTNREV